MVSCGCSCVEVVLVEMDTFGVFESCRWSELEGGHFSEMSFNCCPPYHF